MILRFKGKSMHRTKVSSRILCSIASIVFVRVGMEGITDELLLASGIAVINLCTTLQILVASKEKIVVGLHLVHHVE